MGKAKKKGKKKSEFDEFFETAPTEEQWLSGVSAAAMDTDDRAGPPQPAVQAEPTGDTGAEVMDTSEGPLPNARRGSRLKPAVLKRGQRTAVQQKRKHNKVDKALALADRRGSKVAKHSSTKHRKASLKAIY